MLTTLKQRKLSWQCVWILCGYSFQHDFRLYFLKIGLSDLRLKDDWIGTEGKLIVNGMCLPFSTFQFLKGRWKLHFNKNWHVTSSVMVNSAKATDRQTAIYKYRERHNNGERRDISKRQCIIHFCIEWKHT